MCREGQLVTTRDGERGVRCLRRGRGGRRDPGGSEKPGADESPPASPREPSRSEVRMGRLLEGAASAAGPRRGAVHEARLLLADRGLLRGRKSEIIVAGALYYAAASAGAPRTVDDALGWHPDLRTRRAALVRMRVGLDGRTCGRRGYAERHRGLGKEPIVVAAAALVCIKALAAA
eukprot:tig00021046_g17783.t1